MDKRTDGHDTINVSSVKVGYKKCDKVTCAHASVL
jgi:hypothetical protein